MIKVIYMGKDKKSTLEGLKYLIEKGVRIAAVVGQSDTKKGELVELAKKSKIEVLTYEKLVSNPRRFRDIDLIISFLFWKKIEKSLINLPKIGCINLHPAPLPDFRGVAGYNFAVYEGLRQWGVTAHYVDETIDTGDIIKVNRFAINPEEETAFSLEAKTQEHLLELFKEIIIEAGAKGSLPRSPQGNGRYISKKEFENLRKITKNDTLDEIERKIRAFWFPPFQGAVIEMYGKEFTLVNEKLLEEIGKKYRE